jgi:hypothetical protein
MITALLVLWALVSITFFGALAFVASSLNPSIYEMQLEEMGSVCRDDLIAGNNLRSATAPPVECSR